MVVHSMSVNTRAVQAYNARRVTEIADAKGCLIKNIAIVLGISISEADIEFLPGDGFSCVLEKIRYTLGHNGLFVQCTICQEIQSGAPLATLEEIGGWIVKHQKVRGCFTDIEIS